MSHCIILYIYKYIRLNNRFFKPNIENNDTNDAKLNIFSIVLNDLFNLIYLLCSLLIDCN